MKRLSSSSRFSPQRALRHAATSHTFRSRAFCELTGKEPVEMSQADRHRGYRISAKQVPACAEPGKRTPVRAARGSRRTAQANRRRTAPSAGCLQPHTDHGAGFILIVTAGTELLRISPTRYDLPPRPPANAHLPRQLPQSACAAFAVSLTSWALPSPMKEGIFLYGNRP